MAPTERRLRLQTEALVT
jgi:hypothetical protein